MNCTADPAQAWILTGTPVVATDSHSSAQHSDLWQLTVPSGGYLGETAMATLSGPLRVPDKLVATVHSKSRRPTLWRTNSDDFLYDDGPSGPVAFVVSDLTR